MVDADFNLLAALDVLLDEQSVVRAADRLRLSPSAMSRTLTRLRRVLGDPVLVRAGRGLVPSPRAYELRACVKTVIEDVRSVLSGPAASSPRQFQQTLTLRMSDGLIESLGPPLWAEVESQAPGLRLRFAAKADRLNTGLRDGSVDLETGVVGRPTSPEIVAVPLFADRFVAAVRTGHPWALRPPSAEQYLTASHVASARGPDQNERVDHFLDARGERRRVAVAVPGFGAALALAANTDLVATVPDLHTSALRRGMVTVALPWDLPPISVSLLWHPRSEADPAHRWLRSTVRRLAERLFSSP